MGLYLLHTGKHVGDHPDPKTGKNNPNHVFQPGDTVADDKVDLAASFPEKFSYLGQRPGVGNVPTTPDSLDAQIKALQEQKAALERDKAKGEAAQKATAAGANPAETRKALDAMTPDELKKFVEDEEIDMRGFKPKHPGDPKKLHEERLAYVKAHQG